MKKKKEIPMPKIYRTAALAAKVKVYTIVAVLLSVAGTFGFFYWASGKEKVEYVQKGVVTNYVCEVVGGEPEANVLAVRCYTK